MNTAECISRGHPDKIADQISDAILDECLKQDPNTRAGIEVLGGHGIISIVGEMTTLAKVNVKKIVRKVLIDIGLFDKMKIRVCIIKQSPDISQGVDTGGAGDQGIMVGYACNENKDLIPNELYWSRFIIKELWKLQSSIILPDGKSQVTIDNNKIIRLVISNQTTDEEYLKKAITKNIIPKLPLSKDCLVFINPTGKFRIGGFDADAGLTGRKIVVDAYGPRVPVGGGAFSGKDPTKVDRSAAYMARKIAVDYLKKYKAKEVRVEIAYSIGKDEPMMAVAYIDKKMRKIDDYDLRPKEIIKYLKLRKPIYYKTAQLGHFGNGFLWDK